MEAIKRAQQGDRQAIATVLDQLYQQCRRHVEKYCMAIPMLEVEDLMQSFMVEALTWIRDFDPDQSSWKTWTYNKLRWFCSDYARDRKSHPVCCYENRSRTFKISRVSLSTPIAGGAKELHEVNEAFQAFDDSPDEGIGHIVDKLPTRTQTIFELLYVEGLTMREAGNVVGLSESRVSQIHSDALELLRRLARIRSQRVQA